MTDCTAPSLLTAVSMPFLWELPEKKQRPDSGLEERRFAIASLKLSQEDWSLLLRSCFPHDLAPVQRLTLAGRLSSRAIREQVLGREWPGMRDVCVERED